MTKDDPHPHAAPRALRIGRRPALIATVLGLASTVAMPSGLSTGHGAEIPLASQDAEPDHESSISDAERSARDSYFDALEHRGRPVGYWPFEGFVESPPPFPRAAQPRPIATVEWRQKNGRLQESHVVGDAEALRICRALRPTLTDDERAPGNAWQPPDREMGRGAWSTAFVDCYEVAEGGPWITVTHCGGRHTLETHLVGFDQLGTAIVSTGEPVPGWCVDPINAMSGPLFEWGDFDDNGSMDVLIGSFQTSLGLALNHQRGWLVLTDVSERRARVEPIGSIGTDIVDLDADGKAEFLVRGFRGTTCLDDRHHNFYTTQCLGIEHLHLVDLRGRHRFEEDGFAGEFPSFEWLAFNPESRFKPLLSEKMKRALIDRTYPTSAEPPRADPDPTKRPPRVVRTFSTGHAWREIMKMGLMEDMEVPYVALQLVDPDGNEITVCDYARDFGATLGCVLDTHLPEDIDGDGRVETVIGFWSAGTQCFVENTLYRLEPDGGSRVLAERDGFCQMRFDDLGHDGTIDVEEWVHFRYVFGCGACSNPYARTVHRLEDGDWVVDVEAMRTAPPDRTTIDAFLEELESEDWQITIPPNEHGAVYAPGMGRLWEFMVPLIYEGHGKTALDLFHAAWPDDLPFKKENLAIFVELLRKTTPFWDELQTIQNPPVEWPNRDAIAIVDDAD